MSAAGPRRIKVSRLTVGSVSRHFAASRAGKRYQTRLVPDFLIRHEDSSRWDMIELKKPSEAITLTRKGVEGVGKHAAYAIRQLMEYRDAVSTPQARAALNRAYGTSPFDPCLVVVIGRGSPTSRFRWRSPRAGTPDVNLVTYDFMLERARTARAFNDRLLLKLQAERITRPSP